jgi:DNA polymerase-4
MNFFPLNKKTVKHILHVDGDAFFASCEVALNPKLKGKPVVVGLEKGIASAMTYEAKKMGVVRGMRLFEIRKVCPEAIILPSDFKTYTIFSERMYNIVRRYTDTVEEYSIDECFADLSEPINRIYKKGGGEKDVFNFIRNIQNDLYKELGMTFSIGLGPTKVLAKIGSKLEKPNGLVFMTGDLSNTKVANLPVGSIWGIGSSTAEILRNFRIYTLSHFLSQDEVWIRNHGNKHMVDLWYELKGMSVMPVIKERETQKSISQTRTFPHRIRDVSSLLKEMSQNVEGTTYRLRKLKLQASHLSFFIKDTDFKYFRKDIILEKPTSVPSEILSAISKTISEIYIKGKTYRASGVTLSSFCPASLVQQDIFQNNFSAHNKAKLYETIDNIDRKFGKNTIHLASSIFSINQMEKNNFRRLSIPYMGAVI